MSQGRPDEAARLCRDVLEQFAPLVQGYGELLLWSGKREASVAMLGAAAALSPPLGSLSLARPTSRQLALDDTEVLFAFHSNPLAVRPPFLSRKQVTVGPFVPTTARDGHIQTLSTPKGSYDIAAALKPLGRVVRPDIVVVLADATAANLPRNLGAVSGCKVLLLGDTHHLDHPLQTLLGYALSERFDWVISTHYRHHLHFSSRQASRMSRGCR